LSVSKTLAPKLILKLKKYTDAVFAYGKLVEVRPTKENMFSFGYACQLNQNFEQSAQVYQQLVNQHPAELNAWYNLGEVYLALNNPHQALTAFKKAKELNHALPNLPMRMAYCYKLLNNFHETERILIDVLQQPTMPEQFKIVARNELAQLHKERAVVS
jgi:tetratricopeptide (TPR) repeat protein